MTKRVPHPISMIFPMMDDAEIEELASDIVLHGLREPIWVHRDGSILDGRNRYEACYRAEVPCKALTFEGEDRDLLSFSLSMNLHRRHMTISQRAAVAANIANLEHGTNRFADKIEGSIDPSTKTAAISSAYAAEAMGVGEKSVDKARKVKSEDPELFGKIQEGKVSVNKAYNSLSKKPEKDTAKPSKKSEPRPAAPPPVSNNIGQFQSWLASGARLLDAFGSGENVASTIKANALSIDRVHLDAVCSLIDGLVAGMNAGLAA